MFRRRVFATFGIATCAPFLTAQGLAPLAGQTSTLEETEKSVSQAPVVFEGIVFRDGAPVEGAVVVSSAGGKAVTEQNGRYRLEAEVPADAQSVGITAFGTAGQVANTMVELSAERQPAWVSPLELAQGTACQPSWLPTFGSVQGVEDGVQALAVFDDGSGPSLYLAGDFDEAGGVGISGIVKWDGSSWSQVGNGLGLNSRLWTLTVFDDGSGPALYAGGDFSTAGGTAQYIARWDGSSWSPLGAGVLGPVYALVVFDDGTGPALYAGGGFMTAGGVAADHIAKWDGSSWSPLGAGVLGAVHALEVYDDGDGPALYAAGSFAQAGGIAANKIAKWDGSTWSPLGAGLNVLVLTLAVFDDGGGPALYAGGEFDLAGGNPAKSVAKWDGSSWSALGSGMGGRVDALTVFDDGTGPALYAGGTFATAGGAAASRIARWDGSSWSPLGSGMSAGFSPFGYVGALAVFDDGSGPALFAGGDFDAAGSAGARNIAKWQRASWSALGRGLTPAVLALTVFDDGRGPALYAGGTFAQAGGASKIARWDGSGWEPLGSGVDGTVRALTVFDDGSGPALCAAGNFSKAGGLMAPKHVAKWDGASWSAIGGGPGDSLQALTVFDDGTGPALYSAGQTTPGVEKWSGITWRPVGGGINSTFNSTVNDLEVYDDGTGPALYAGGDFLFAGGYLLSKWDGSTWSRVGSGLSAGFYTNPRVEALAVFDDGSGPALYAAGQFGVAGGVSVSHIAKWDGSSWSALGSGINGSVSALTVLDNGCGALLCVGGSFVKAGSFVARDIASWDGSRWLPLGGGMGGMGFTDVSALAAFNDRTGLALYAGGTFEASSGDSNLAKWGSPDTTAPLITCPASIVVDDRPGTLGETLTFLVSAEDEEDPTPVLECHPPSGSHFPRGTTLVVCTATDFAGNQASCQFTVTVGAKVPEVLSSPPQARR